MPIVTIRGQMGSGVGEIAREVARLLPGEYMDHEIIKSIAQLVGHPVAVVAETEYSGSLTQRIKAALEGSHAAADNPEDVDSDTWKESLNDSEYMDALKAVIEDLALETNVVIYGRGSQFILRNNPSALHVLVIAPLPIRIGRVMSSLKIDEETAIKEIEAHDTGRRAFIKKFFQRDIEDPQHYDVIVNTERLQIEESAQIIVKAAQRKTPWGHG
jgi:cytidylate kinase